MQTAFDADAAALAEETAVSRAVLKTLGSMDRINGVAT